MKPIPHGTVNGYSHHRCRCDKCRKAKTDYVRERGYERTPERKAAKRQWDREHLPICECGREMARGSERCERCRAADDLAYRRLVEEMWAEGMTARQIGEALGWDTRYANRRIVTLRRQCGFNLPHRRTPEQLARITAGSDESLAKARAARRSVAA